MKFHHVGVHVSDFDKSKPLYDAIMNALDFEDYDVPGHICHAWGTVTNSFRIVQPPSGEISASSSHICFEAPDEEAVKKFYETGVKLGAKGLSAPNEYVDWGMRHLTTMLEDYDGNHIEAVYVDKENPVGPEETRHQ
ncbi:hypothetical protein HFP57_16095 [Parasphingopyxis algicola]|uniref:VOC family protein n=1 Tax=Parasphingopyxis algicola TaxID=2026624 RepID=UPI0015A13346|nr:VOC family protein [Parasphingopyxis algicola]QLC26401.1 hypothetical protein HFP57_16095 [Parasphingopyxis algicola]